MDLFAREQQLYENAVSDLKNAEQLVTPQNYEKIVNEYGKLLKQFQLYRQMTGNKDNAKKGTPTMMGHVAGHGHSVRMEDSSHYDMLTGIFNHKYLRDSVERLLSVMGRQSDSLSLVKVDIDNFQEYNNIYGYKAGDDCIRRIAEVLKDCLYRERDFIARFGGEEFIATLPNTPEDGARLVAERMLDEIRDAKIPFTRNEEVGYVTVSIGLVTSLNNHGCSSIEDFFRRLEEALAQAKTRGRDRYVFLEV